MKVGVFSAILSGLSLGDAPAHSAGLQCDTVELGTGAYPGNAHREPDDLLAHEGKAKEFQAAIAGSGLTISSLSCHGNPLHPDKALADERHAVFQATVKLAAKPGAEVVTTFSGCPGDAPGAKYSNWVTCPWPPDFLESLMSPIEGLREGVGFRRGIVLRDARGAVTWTYKGRAQSPQSRQGSEQREESFRTPFCFSLAALRTLR